MSAETGIDQGRSAFQEHRWTEAYQTFREADKRAGLPAADLERLATAEILIGESATGLESLTRAHEEYLVMGDVEGAARCAGWMGMQLMFLGEQARAGGWFARGQRLMDELAEPSAVQGLLLLPEGLGKLYGGNPAGALQAFSRVAEFGQRFHDKDVSALGLLGRGQATLMLGHPDKGLKMFDEVMVAVTAGELSPIPSGIIYCAVIGNCHLVFDLERALEWTAALDRWCSARPDMVSFSGQCQSHRAELFRLHGAWAEALMAAAAAQGLSVKGDPQALYGGYYQQGEVERLSGKLDDAEASYRQAARSGYEPQPGLALLWLARGNAQQAQAMIRRAAAAADVATRRNMLPALVEIELAASDLEAARQGSQELEALASEFSMPMIRAVAGQADGAVRLADGDPSAALKPLREAWRLWQELGVPYEAARCQALSGSACRALGDEASALMYLEAAHAALLDLGAAPAATWAASLLHKGMLDSRATPGTVGLLTRRELEVLHMVATGKGNRAIAGELYLSEKTVARHVSNIFLKLGLSSRSAATSYAYEHGLAG
ncbi:helix-turn-helix transcriptional regulator [Pseudarthrobacter sulfonivorans]|uniref:Helix-turn-helix transcriptional regulator n=1 Tax=Pseudarthrobacter sulfonivorans TaxID=121292 RepID=A0A0U3PK11_9MICC|nr:helix-turn-helix transcriptional regulator [Pseudarthrobacter sulfonivorans]ALV42712.1 helix-turn-helix transcriptional regulator [Pseudarthrobacter sulfonivorans]